MDLNELIVMDLNLPAHDIGLDRQLSTTAIHEHDKVDTARPPPVHHRVPRGPDRTSPLDDVIDQNDVPVIDPTRRELRLPDDRSRPDHHEVISVQRDIDRT